MVMETNPHGWAKRRARARRRQRHGMTDEARVEIRAIRARHSASQAAGNAAPVATPLEEPAPAHAPENGAEGMSWDAMAAELRAAGWFVHPRIGEAKLRQRLMEKRNAEKE